ncbi:MAG: universal stress protein, partial [Nitrososphaeraceae archaeon]
LGRVQTRARLYPDEKQGDKSVEANRVLVAMDGSFPSLRALSYAESLFKYRLMARVYLVHIIDWPDQEDESVDSTLVSQMQQEGRRMLKSLTASPQRAYYERVVKLGDPAAKIAEIAEKLEIDFIIMGRKGLGRSQNNVGHVTGKVLQITSKPVILIK